MSMKGVWIILLACSFGIIALGAMEALASPENGASGSKFFEKGLQAYSSGHYSLAASSFQEAIKGGLQDSATFYNAGLAFGHGGDWHKALAAAAASYRQSPWDYQIGKLLEMAQKKSQTPFPSLGGFWIYLKLLPPWGWALVGSLFWFFGWGRVGKHYLIMSKKDGRCHPSAFPWKWIFPSSVLAISFLLAGMFDQDIAPIWGVVTAPKTGSVRSGPSQGHALMAQLPTGTAVEILLSQAGWHKIRSKDGEKGWLNGADVWTEANFRKPPEP